MELGGTTIPQSSALCADLPGSTTSQDGVGRPWLLYSRRTQARKIAQPCVKWWEDSTIQAKLSEWGVTQVVPPADDSVIESIFSGVRKYRAVTLHVPNKDCTDEVKKQMEAYNASTGSYHLFEVVADV
mmetsp:Transcript_71425/g.198255  ORF Transcript_71425/g.198255 Transcript_71425/m.198255 type:complete len:128 (-) Transcript_71425:159-542(-)